MAYNSSYDEYILGSMYIAGHVRKRNFKVTKGTPNLTHTDDLGFFYGGNVEKNKCVIKCYYILQIDWQGE